jgi:uncharacterized membrane protein
MLGTAVAWIIAIGLLLGQKLTLQFIGLTQGASEMLLAQVLGAAFVGYGLLSWLAKDFMDSKARQGALLSLFIFNAAGFVVTLLGVLSRQMRSGGWTVVIIFLVFAAAYGYFQFAGGGEE